MLLYIFLCIDDCYLGLFIINLTLRYVPLWASGSMSDPSSDYSSACPLRNTPICLHTLHLTVRHLKEGD